MGFFRFRRSFKLLPGIRMNLGKKGPSFTFGGKGFKTTISGKRRTTTIGIPGTGLSYTTSSPSKPDSKAPLPSSAPSPGILPMNTQASLPPPKQRNYGNWLAVFFGCVALISIMTKCGGSSSNTATNPPSLESPKPIVESTAPSLDRHPFELPKTATPPVSDTASQSTPVLTYGRSTQPAPTFSKPTASIDNFRPKTVKLTQDVDMPLVENNQLIGSQHLRIGAVVTLKAIKGDSVIVEYNNGSKQLPVTATDLLDQMVAAAGD